MISITFLLWNNNDVNYRILQTQLASRIKHFPKLRAETRALDFLAMLCFRSPRFRMSLSSFPTTERQRRQPGLVWQGQGRGSPPSRLSIIVRLENVWIVCANLSQITSVAIFSHLTSR
jgi:hypothetical protein